jgi:hypothetical protein
VAGRFFRRASVVRNVPSPAVWGVFTLNASLNLQINDIDLPGVSYVSTLATARVNYSFSTSVFLNALVQYNTDTRQISSNVRFNIIHRPLSDFFIVYNERRDERTNSRLDRALIAKLTYMLAL